jgi:hypothetical protein
MRAAAGSILVVSVIFHAGLAAAQAPVKSVYRHRDIVMAALAAADPEMLAHRRPFAVNGGPAALTSAVYDPRVDITIDKATFARAAFRSLRWHVEVTNRSRSVAYRDLLYVATYRDRDGRMIDERHELIKDVVQPGQTLAADLNDGTLNEEVADARIAIVAAEALRPARPR